MTAQPSTLKARATIPLLPATPPTTPEAWQAVRIVLQNALSQLAGAAGTTGVNVIPQQYALVAGASLPPIASTSNCSVSADTSTVLFGAASYKITITGTPATVTFATDASWPLNPGWQWIVSFFQQASAAIAGKMTVTSSGGTAYNVDFTTTTGSTFTRLSQPINMGADSSAHFGLSVTFTGGTGDTVWLDGLMMEPYFGVAMQPSPFISTSPALTVDHVPDGSSYVKLLGARAVNNIAYNFVGAWSSSTAYLIGEEVTYQGGYWIAVANSTNSAPSLLNNNWQAVGATTGFTQTLWKSTSTANPTLGATVASLMPGVGTGSLTVGANTLNAGSQLRAVIRGFVSTAPSSTADVFPQIVLGSSVIGSSTQGSGVIDTTSVGYPFAVEAILSCLTTGATGTCVGCFFGVVGGNSSAVAQVPSTWGDSFKGTTIALDTTVANTFDVRMATGGACGLLITSGSLEQL